MYALSSQIFLYANFTEMFFPLKKYKILFQNFARCEAKLVKINWVKISYRKKITAAAIDRKNKLMNPPATVRTPLLGNFTEKIKNKMGEENQKEKV